MDYYTLLATISLTLQITVLVLLVTGYSLKRLKRFRQHGITMFAAVVLHLITILTVMIPSLIRNIPLIFTNVTKALQIVILIHIITGATAAVLGIWIVASWRLRQSLKYCAPKRKIMRITLQLWLTVLGIGILLYLIAYTTLFS